MTFTRLLLFSLFVVGFNYVQSIECPESCPQGIPGRNGIPGPPGMPGERGDTGPMGEDGSPGLRGIPGARGQVGDIGHMGPPGRASASSRKRRVADDDLIGYTKHEIENICRSVFNDNLPKIKDALLAEKQKSLQ